MSATPPSNVIPARRGRNSTSASTTTTRQETLRALVEERLAKACGNRIRARIVWEYSNSNVFVTKPGAFTDLAVSAIEEVTGRKPELSTSGGTSDARFISSYCPVIEFGLVGQTMHQIDERTPVSRSGEADEDLSRACWSGISRNAPASSSARHRRMGGAKRYPSPRRSPMGIASLDPMLRDRRDA